MTELNIFETQPTLCSNICPLAIISLNYGVKQIIQMTKSCTKVNYSYSALQAIASYVHDAGIDIV